MTLPEPSFAHLLGLTDDTGLFEHARHLLPSRDHGYTTDDAARAWIAVCRQPDPEPGLVRASLTYAGFLDHARRPDGSFHNRLSFDRRFTDAVGSEDSQGRALWALGTATRLASQPWLRELSADLLRHAPAPDWSSPRANAFATLGFVEALASDPSDPHFAGLLQGVARRLPRPSPGSWPWPEKRLAYDNARLPEALLAAGVARGDDSMADDGLRLLAWLVEVETSGGHFSFTPTGGWEEGEPRPGFDQQPVEAAAMADAAVRAWRVTGDREWAKRVVMAGEWLSGSNDIGTALYDPATGACHDGLTSQGVNANAGAESTVSAILVLQQARYVVSAQGGE
ncbi:MAG: hypothetical protein A2V75_04085 [Actinobacteria bacterium RBG_16_70_17]|nr:MAG: hypothetical protein A2V75_04085 [Actinobacteria bacterium RBG_16_70_17]